MQRSLLTPLLTIGVAMVLAACGGSSDDDDAPAGGSRSAASTSENADQLQKYAECMRSHGVPEFPDPQNGQLMLNESSGLDPSSPQFQSAARACKSLQPAGVQGGSGQSADQEEQLQKFASCMRKHGAKDFPDPSSEGGGKFQITGVDPNSAQFKSAMRACRSLLPGGGTP
jgi:hypothetical protein